MKNSPPELEEEPPEIKTHEEILEEEITFISEDMNLKKDTVIQNRKVVLDMITIKTFEHNFFILAEEFISNHSVIQNFSCGNIQVEAGIAKGELRLILNGEFE